jgi:uncharacterized protein with GYD domain
MGYYIMLTKLTSDGRKTIMRNPGRIWEVNHEVEAMGAKIIAQYAVLGQCHEEKELIRVRAGG